MGQFRSDPVPISYDLDDVAHAYLQPDYTVDERVLDVTGFLFRDLRQYTLEVLDAQAQICE